MSIISYSTTPTRKGPRAGDEMSSISSVSGTVVAKAIPQKKILEEEEYLGRMAKIIKRDFIPSCSGLDDIGQSPSEYGGSTNRTEYTFQDGATPGTDRTQSSTTSTIRSRRQACSSGLNEFLDRYTSEDNEYFDKLQRKELRRHRAKYPWLYRDKSPHNKQVSDQLKLLSVQDQAALSSSDSPTNMIDWPHNPMNSLFYPPSIEKKPNSWRSRSTVNYNSTKYIHEPIFKTPLPPQPQPTSGSSSDRLLPFSSSSSKFTVDKIGVDGKLIDGSEELPSVNGYSYVPAPDATPKVLVDERKVKTEANKFYIPLDSPRDELARRIYQDRVAKHIRTPRRGDAGGLTPASSIRGTPSSSRRSYADFSFSPERIKTPRSKLR